MTIRAQVTAALCDAATARLPVIMLTVHEEEKLKVQGLKGGADDYSAARWPPRASGSCSPRRRRRRLQVPRIV